MARRTRAAAPRPLLTAFLAGAVGAAWLAAAGNHLLLEHLDPAERAAVPLVGAPLVEEVAKALALLLVGLAWRELLASLPAAMLAGGMVGLGFACTENLGYLMLAAVQGGPGGLARASYVRGLTGGVVHAVFTASAGAGLAWAVAGRRHRVAAATLGLLAAVVQHAAWNGLGSGAITDVLCNPAAPGAACRAVPDALDLLVSVPLVTAAAVGPGVVALVLLARRHRVAPGLDLPRRTA